MEFSHENGLKVVPLNLNSENNKNILILYIVYPDISNFLLSSIKHRLVFIYFSNFPKTVFCLFKKKYLKKNQKRELHPRNYKKTQESQQTALLPAKSEENQENREILKSDFLLPVDEFPCPTAKTTRNQH